MMMSACEPRIVPANRLYCMVKRTQNPVPISGVIDATMRCARKNFSGLEYKSVKSNILDLISSLIR